MAESAGLDITDTRHMDELYQYVSAMLPGLKGFHELGPQRCGACYDLCPSQGVDDSISSVLSHKGERNTS